MRSVFSCLHQYTEAGPIDHSAWNRRAGRAACISAIVATIATVPAYWYFSFNQPAWLTTTMYQVNAAPWMVSTTEAAATAGVMFSVFAICFIGVRNRQYRAIYPRRGPMMWEPVDYLVVIPAMISLLTAFLLYIVA